MPELAVKIKINPSNSSNTTSGTSHHFFSGGKILGIP
jgi:hypothetical protein